MKVGSDTKLMIISMKVSINKLKSFIPKTQKMPQTSFLLFIFLTALLSHIKRGNVQPSLKAACGTGMKCEKMSQFYASFSTTFNTHACTVDISAAVCQ